ncbi:MAG TPA: metallopeptidase TldD-related protein [Bryobacteraceae bacterium]|nr:metallopeptidase TldD-related protein [Bryobacteraceae bacterium]
MLSKKLAAITVAPLSLGMAALVLCVTARAVTAPAPTLIGILQAELNREFTGLKAKADPAPYYMAYEVTDQETGTATASLGAITLSQRSRARVVDTTIRVGSPQFDNYHSFRGDTGRFTAATLLSLDDNPDQIRQTLWAESNRVYKLAAQRFLQLKTNQQLLVDEKDVAPDFSPATPETYAQLPESYAYGLNDWSQKLRGWSSEFNKHPGILDSAVNFQAKHEVRTFVNTEGTAIQRGDNLFRLEIMASTLAADGMPLQLLTTMEASDPAHLPAAGLVDAKVRDLAGKMDALLNAPPAEPIVCPAILSGRASAVFFHEIFGHRIEGHRQKDEAEGQTFTKMIGQKVLPDFISVNFDPTRRTYNGSDLIGYYEYDDEGVKARPVAVVQNGILKTFLLSRSPVGQFKNSNGHGRRQPGFEAESRQSNLIVESSRQVSDADLRQQLIAEAKRQGKPYGLYFEEVSSGYTTTRREGLQAFTVVPLIVYRVYADGRPDELIRGVDIVGTPLASFQKILATSDHSEVFNGYCGAESGSVPVSAVSPAILVSEIEIQKKQNAQQRQPLLPRPEVN